MKKNVISSVAISIPLAVFVVFALLNIRNGIEAGLFMAILAVATILAIGNGLTFVWFRKAYPDKPWLPLWANLAWTIAFLAVLAWFVLHRQ